MLLGSFIPEYDEDEDDDDVTVAGSPNHSQQSFESFETVGAARRASTMRPDVATAAGEYSRLAITDT